MFCLFLSMALASGRWVLDNGSVCDTPPRSNECLSAESGHPRYFYNQTASADPCSRLAGTSILFVGDSYVRHVYQAMAAILSGNHHNAALVEAAPSECHDSNQIKLTVCRFHLKKDISVCAGRASISARIAHTPIPRIYAADFLVYDIIVWGFGNHPSDSAYGDPDRPTISDADSYATDILIPTCRCIPSIAISTQIESLLVDYHGNCTPWCTNWSNRVVFLQNHYRPKPGDGRYAGESRDAQDKYYRRMPLAVKEVCNITRVVDTYAPTREFTLLNESGFDPLVHSMDPAHWGWTMNLVKARILINALLPA